MADLISVRHILVTGGARSGKSKFAENMAGKFGGKVIYLATAQALDNEMRERILKHQQRRSKDWVTIEEPLEIAEVLSKFQTGATVLLDCLTLYLSNLYFKYEELSADKQEQTIDAKITNLAETIKRSNANIIIVSNEIGWGLVPEKDLARRFRDLAGNANQMIAAVCDEAYLLVSGLPVQIKGGRNV